VKGLLLISRLVLALLMCGAGCSPPKWAMYQANSRHTGHLPGVTHAVPLEKVWVRSFPDALLTPPVIGNDKVFMTAGNDLFALSTEDGSTQWTYTAPIGGFWSGVAAVGNRVYAVNRANDGSDDGRVVCLRASSGGILWSKSGGEGSVAPVTVGEGHVFIHAKPCILHFRDAQNGDPELQCGGGECQDPNSKAAAYLDGRAYIATAMDVYYCDENGANGPVGPFGTLSGARSTPMLVQLDGPQSSEYALVVRTGNALRVVNPEDGDPYWSGSAVNAEDEGVASGGGLLLPPNASRRQTGSYRRGALELRKHQAASVLTCGHGQPGLLRRHHSCSCAGSDDGTAPLVGRGPKKGGNGWDGTGRNRARSNRSGRRSGDLVPEAARRRPALKRTADPY